MKLAHLQDLTERTGPFVTVYLDTSGDAEDAAKAIELRWRSAREQLSEQGADTADLQAVEDHLRDHEKRTGRRGQALVAAHGEVVFDEELPVPPTEYSDDELTHYGPLPHLMPYLRLRAARIPHVIAVVDHQGADVTTVNARSEARRTNTEGDDHPLHKSRSAGEGDEQRHQNAVEEQWQRNAEQAADEITKQALRSGAETIVLAGDVQQRKLVHERLRKGLQDRVVETEASHRDRKASDESLRHEVDEAVRNAVEERVTRVVEEFERERGEQGRAVEGWEDTVEALQREQVRALLWTPAAGRSEKVASLHIGPAPSHIAWGESSLTRMGVQDVRTAPASAAVVRALAGTDADLILADSEKVELAEGIGAVLRYSDGTPAS
jgi:hypothetical protein